nr:hypothetical protein [Tanacetum cinerariifolium]
MMFESISSISHPTHQELYNALGESIKIEKLEARYGKDQTSKKKRSHDDQDPPENCKGENKKRRRKDTRGSSSKKGNAQDDSTHYERVEDVEEPRQEKSKSMRHNLIYMKFLNKEKITKEDLEGPTFKLLNKRFKNSVELEYNLEQCHLALTDLID